MSIRTNTMKAVPLLRRRLTAMSLGNETLAAKLNGLMLELNNIKDIFSTVKRNEEQLLDMLTFVDNLLRNYFNKTKFEDISKHILKLDDEAQLNKGKDIEKPSSSQEEQNKKRMENDVPIEVKLETLKSELDNIKAQFLDVKKNKELPEMLASTLRNFNTDKIIESSKANFYSDDATQANQEGIDKSSSSLETQDKKMMEDESIEGKLESLKYEFDKMKGQFLTMKKTEEELRDKLRVVESFLRSFKEKNSAEIVEHPGKTLSFELLEDKVLKVICKNIQDSTHKLQPVRDSLSKTEANNSSSQAPQTVYPTLSFSPDNNEMVDLVLKRIKVSYDILNLHSKLCLLSLSVFPENVVMKKRHTIYWWIGEGFVKNTGEKTAEEVGEDVFYELMDCDLILPNGNGKCPVVNKFKINPWIHHMLVSSVVREKNQLFGTYSQIIDPSHQIDISAACLVLDKPKFKISDLRSDHWRTIFNVGANYLNFEPQWMAEMKKLVVLQLGRWQESPSHHIEVESVEFLKAKKHLKYLSLRGISRIFELPPSISQLVSLEILDLKACHNLEKLPNEIALLRKLTHLDVSQCYLLEGMPKGIEKLSDLQVLKGFVISSSSKTPCRITDLAKLKKLKRLSIHIGSEALIHDGEFERLVELLKVKCLKISWGVSSNTRYKDIQINFPKYLEKLDLEGFPRETIPEWLKPSKLPEGLKKLYIKGGKLKSLNNGENNSDCSVEIVRLKYLKYLKINKVDLQYLFPSLRYAERKESLVEHCWEWSKP